MNTTVKTNIVQVIFETKVSENSPKHAALLVTSSISTKQLSDFASGRTNFIFEKLNIMTFFLSKKPDTTWSDDEDFKAGTEVVGRLRVTNDAKERGIALIQNSTARSPRVNIRADIFCRLLKAVTGTTKDIKTKA